MDQKPRNRVDGIDDFMVQKAAFQVMKEMEENEWNQGEVELLPTYLSAAIKNNSERIRKLEPFTVCEITAQKLL